MLKDDILYHPSVLPDVVWLLSNSIGRAAIAAQPPPGVSADILQSWIDELNRYVAINGKFSKFQVMYLPLSPPPVFWDYKCKKCLKFVQPNGCNWVSGEVAPSGWCAIWVPPAEYKALTWPQELLSGNW